VVQVEGGDSCDGVAVVVWEVHAIFTFRARSSCVSACFSDLYEGIIERTSKEESIRVGEVWQPRSEDCTIRDLS